MYYSKKELSPIFEIGETVMVVDNPYKNCPFYWTDEMTEYCGKEVHIRDRWYVPSKKIYSYLIDGSPFKWCTNCFVKIQDSMLEQTESEFFDDFSKLF